MAILDRHGVIVGVNEAWRANVDAGRDGETASMPGRNYLDECRRLENRGNRAARDVRRGIEAVLAGQTTTLRFELPSGRPLHERWHLLIVDALKGEDGGAVLTRVDVTDRRRADAQAEDRRRHVAHIGRMEVMSEVASAVALEIKQPVAAMSLNALAGATLLGTPRTTFDGLWSDSREAWQMFKDIYDDASRVAAVIEHVHQHVRKSAAKSGIVDLGEVCRATAQLLEHEAARQDTVIELDLDAELPVIVGDQVEIHQMVMCLTLNALDAVASSTRERAIIIGTAARDSMVELYVRDNGPGLSSAVRQKVFESFVTTKERSLGMGLIIVRSIAERHGGHVSAENAPNGGAIFRVRVPIERGASS